jgi:hypothetical protein
MQEHEDAVRSKLLHSARYAEIVQGFQRRLALVIFDHITLYMYP